LTLLNQLKQEIEGLNQITPLSIAMKFIGVGEYAGLKDNPQIMAMLNLDNNWPKHDEVPWCSAFVNYIAYLSGMKRTKDLRARSWLKLESDDMYVPESGNTIAIFSRGSGSNDPKNYTDSGHVGFVLYHTTVGIGILGGNQRNKVGIQIYPYDERFLGFRTLTKDSE